VIESFIPVYFLLESFDLGVVKALKRMHKLNFLYHKHFSCVYIHRFVDLSRSAVSYQLAFHPLQDLTLHFGSRRALVIDEVIFKMLSLMIWEQSHKFLLVCAGLD